MLEKTSILVTGVGAPPGYNAAESLCNINNFRIVAADCNEFAAGHIIPGVMPVKLPSASESHKELYINSILEIIKEQNIKYILPCSEQESLILSQSIQRLHEESNIIIITAHANLVWLGMDKLSTMIKCEELKIRAPKTFLLNEHTLESEVLSFAEKLGYPLIIKPRIGQGSRGLILAHTTKELLGALQICQSNGKDMLLQEFIPGEINNVYTYGALVDNGNIIASTMHHKLATNSHIGGSATAGILVNNNKFRQFAEDIFHKTGNWHGLIALEAKRCAVTGEFFLMEINPRLWGFSALSRLAGLNFPYLAIEVAMGKKVKNCNTDAQAGFRALRRFIDTPITSNISCY
ncbi:MAG: ATP-grasp domain-containing protein [bacterium]